LIGCPISRSFTTCCVCPELRSLPSPGVTRLQRYYEPLRHPRAPGLSLAGVRLVIPDHAAGLPVLRSLSLCTCCRQYPGAAAGRRLRSSHPTVSAFPEIAVGSACTSSFSRLARRSLALRPAHARRHLYVTRYTEGFSHFVTSMTAPVASGWSVRRVGLAPTGKAPPSHGARRVGVWRGGFRLSVSVAAPFVWRCLSGSAVAPFPHPPHRTGRADFPHPALGQDLTPSSTARRAQAGSNVRARSARRGARVDSSRPLVAWLCA
jgi:hypothetical protein